MKAQGIQPAWLLSTALMVGLIPGLAAAAEPAAAGVNNWEVGYTLGFSLGQRMGADLKELDTKAFNEGFLDAFGGQPGKLTQEQMSAAFEQFQQQRVADMEAARKKLQDDNLAAANAFLQKNGKRKGVKQTKSGLQYEVLAKGKGANPKADDLVTAHYRGTLIDGTEFDTSIGGDPVEFPLDRVIPGWQEGVALMTKGAKYKFFLPPALAYGEQGAGQAIGPNQALIFEVELVDFRTAPAEETAPAMMEEAGEPPVEMIEPAL